MLTVLYHSDPRRIGDQAILPWRDGAGLTLSRMTPVFGGPDGNPTGPLADPGLSRRGLNLRPLPDGLHVAGDGPLPYRLGGRRLEGPVRLPFALLDEGLSLHCGRGVLLWIETRQALPTPSGDPALAGPSEATDRVRARVRQLAPHPLPVAVVGEPDTGRHRVAAALHAARPRPDGPWVSAVGGGWAPAALRDAFERARGGTLCLDHVEQLSTPTREALLAALDAQEAEPPEVRARLVCITSTEPAALSQQAGLSVPLAFRLFTARIDVSPLRDRPLDLPLLFVRALREEFDRLDIDDRLIAAERPWLERPLVEAVLRHGWPGNLRELANLAFDVALAGGEAPHAALPDHWQPQPVAGALFDDPVAVMRPPAAAPSARAEFDTRPWAVPPETLRASLRRNDWRVRAVADDLGIARNTIYAMMARLGIRRPSDLSPADIHAAVQAEGSADTARVARRLEVSERGLKLRMRALGLVLE